MKNLILSGGIAVAAFSFVFIVSSHEAAAQARFHGASGGCPSASVYYANGYFLNYCVPSYYPGFVGPVFQPRYNPIQPPVYNQPFYPYTPVPTYYYPPAPTYNMGYHRGWRR